MHVESVYTASIPSNRPLPGNVERCREHVRLFSATPAHCVALFMMLFFAACGILIGGSRATATGAPPTVEASATPGSTETATAVPPNATPSLRGKVIRIVVAVQAGANYNPLYIHATATCPSGTHLLSGGYESTDPPDARRSNRTCRMCRQLPARYLELVCVHLEIESTAGVNFYALRTVFSQLSGATIIVSTPNQGPITIACPNNYIPTGGGWKSNPNGVRSLQT